MFVFDCLFYSKMFHFILTTITFHLLNSIDLSPYYSVREGYETSSSLSLLLFHDNNDNVRGGRLYQEDGVYLICSLLSDRDYILNGINLLGNTTVENESNRLLRSYLDYRRSDSSQSSSWVAHNPRLSCSLFDSSIEMLYLIGDTIGAVPLFYELQDAAADDVSPQLFVSSQPLYGTNLGFRQLSPVGPGLTLSLDMTSHEVINCHHWSEGKVKSYSSKSVKEMEEDSIKILKSTADFVGSIVNGRMSDNYTTEGIMTELDVQDDSSVLLECALHESNYGTTDSTSNNKRLRFKTQPLIADPVNLPAVVNTKLYSKCFNVFYLKTMQLKYTYFRTNS